MLKLFPSIAEKSLLLFTVSNIRSVGFRQRCSQSVKKSPFLTSDRMNSVINPSLQSLNPPCLVLGHFLYMLLGLIWQYFYLGIIPPNHQNQYAVAFLASDRDFGARLTDEFSKMLNIFFA